MCFKLIYAKQFLRIIPAVLHLIIKSDFKDCLIILHIL